MFRCLVLGLGNPGQRYSGTRHNVGFDFLDFWSQRLDLSFVEKKNFQLACQSSYAGWILAKPLTFMNRSDLALTALLSWCSFSPEEILCVVDNVDLPLGTFRLKRNNGGSSHNGLRSIRMVLGEKGPFWCLHVGIGNSHYRMQDLASHVLGAFQQEEKAVLLSMFPSVVEGLLLLQNGASWSDAQTRINALRVL